jgi:alkanesulfonate monooxygenase SsuD/methylene tetrahydromethanopterin reductase-like flavin-dependent oxidoreductase (luciferase family)
MTDEAVLAEASGVDSYNIGEHYRAGHVDTAGHVTLAAIARRTSRMCLGTSVTVLRHPGTGAGLLALRDPGGCLRRTQLIVGRASSTQSFPLFGFDLADYEDLFEEKLDLLTSLLRDQPVTWSGTVRVPLHRHSPGRQAGDHPHLRVMSKSPAVWP